MTKLSGIQYDNLRIQNYLKSPQFSREEKNLLYSLRSRSNAAKLNYRKMYSSNLKCTLGCQNDEDQFHIFQQCEALKSNTYKDVYENIFKGEICKKEAVSQFLVIENQRLELIKKQPEKQDTLT